ncbi:MAG: CDP-alcohol phosphatidyltransferase family protein [Actinobacteria bacterium]|jgi:CDP-diacylglycerol--glycerol-3-phosphate 3-phosphatidyltransferase|nr:CDP-alcohol phosphatidyltransferase family protein [Actinomycetota bacterium]
MFDGRFRAPIEKAVRPVGQLLRRTGMSPDHLTILGILFAIAAAFSIAQGALRGGLILVILAALPDMLDGALAKAAGSASQRGAFFDSVVDRVTDSLLFGGVAWFFASEKSPHLALLPMAIMGVSSLISYERAKAESLGLYAKGGLMERAERIIVLCVGLLFDSLLTPILWVMLALTVATAIQRFVQVWRQAEVSNTTKEKREVRQVRRVSRQSIRASRRQLSVVSRQRRRQRNG